MATLAWFVKRLWAVPVNPHSKSTNPSADPESDVTVATSLTRSIVQDARPSSTAHGTSDENVAL